MSERFADGARRLAGLAGRVLGWPPHWFWSATPGELATILFDDAELPGGGMTRERMQHLMESDRHG